jgi:hypothetical protein
MISSCCFCKFRENGIATCAAIPLRSTNDFDYFAWLPQGQGECQQYNEGGAEFEVWTNIPKVHYHDCINKYYHDGRDIHRLSVIPVAHGLLGRCTYFRILNREVPLAEAPTSIALSSRGTVNPASTTSI